MPVLQLTQEVIVVLDWKVPSAQLVQIGAEDAEYIPAEQATQLDDSDAPVSIKKWPARQEVQLVAPIAT